MSLFGGQKKSAGVTPSYTGLQIQTAANALPVPIVYGAGKIAPNVIWYDDFRAIPQRSRSSGGKGGSSRGQVTGYAYSAALMLALCEGPINGVDKLWKGQSILSPLAVGLSLFNGDTPQAPWGFLEATHPEAALAYPGTAFLASPSYDLGESATISNHNFQVEGVLFATAYNGNDADPALVLSDFLTNPQYGVGFPGAAIDATSLFGSGEDSSYQTYCRAVGLAFSPVLTDAETASATLARWLQITNSAAVWSGGLLKIVPFGDEEVTGQGVTWAPDVAPVYDLDDDDFLGDAGEDPVKATRTDAYAVPNVQRLEVRDRANSYNAAPVEVRDQAMIEAFGLRVGASITAHEICDLVVGAISAQLVLQRGLYVRVHYGFRLSWEYALLEPMDVVILTDPNLGLDRTPVRIVDVEEGEDGALSITAEEFLQGVATAVRYPVQHAGGTRVDREVAAGPVNAPIVFEPPSALTGGTAEVWCVVSGGDGASADPAWGGCNVWLSLDGSTYDLVGTIGQPARQGVTTAPLAAASGFDAVGVLAVDLSRSAGGLNPAASVAAEAGATLCLVDRELVAFTGASLTGPHRYALIGLYRGLDGSPPAGHASGARFARLDDAVFRYGLPDSVVGRTIHLKFQSFNVFGGGMQDLADCTDYPYATIGSGRFGLVSTALAIGTSLDLGLASQSAARGDDAGFASDPYPVFVDFGLASA